LRSDKSQKERFRSLSKSYSIPNHPEMLGCYFNPKQDQKFEINESLILSGILFYLKAKLIDPAE
jgi:hypothetical protein